MDIRHKYWWNGMKADIARFVAHCDTCCDIQVVRQLDTKIRCNICKQDTVYTSSTKQ
jgi:hypothetical protein